VKTAEGKSRLDLLTGARFLAAVGILLFHLSAIGHLPPWIHAICSWGRCGVCFFFILSGFVLAYNYHDRFATVTIRGYRNFIWARFVRIGPTHVLTLLLITPICLWLNNRGQLLASVGAPVVPASAAARSWIANLFLVQVYVPTLRMEQMYNAPAWSIACEVFFYLMFPFFIAWLSWFANSARRLITLGMIFWLVESAVVIAALFAERKSVGRLREEKIFDLFISRFPLLRFGEFAVGCCAGLLFVRMKKIGTRINAHLLLMAGWTAVGVSLGLFACFPFYRYTSWFSAEIPAFAIIILATAFSPAFIRPLLQHPAMVLLGEASYALYLLHWTAYLTVRWKFGVETPAWCLLLTAVTSVGTSVAFLVGIDRPIRRLLRRNRSISKDDTWRAESSP
jgi:peptidoglycan/LPS O-acetylase OafA/YrhL